MDTGYEFYFTSMEDIKFTRNGFEPGENESNGEE